MKDHTILWALVLSFLLQLSTAFNVQAYFIEEAFQTGDYEQAYKWAIPAAEQGSAYAQYHLGLMYCLGLGSEAYPNEAFKWFRKAAAQGHWQAQSFLGIETAANGARSYARASFSKGLKAYQTGDFETAFKSFATMAEQGNADAQYYIGHMYCFGLGVEPDLDETIKWLIESSDQGNMEARRFLNAIELTLEKTSKAETSTYNSTNKPSIGMRIVIKLMIATLFIVLIVCALPTSFLKENYLKFLGPLVTLFCVVVIVFLFFFMKYQLQPRDYKYIDITSRILSFMLLISYLLFFFQEKLFQAHNKCRQSIQENNYLVHSFI